MTDTLGDGIDGRSLQAVPDPPMNLRHRLVTLDLMAVTAGWLLALVVLTSEKRAPFETGLITVSAIALSMWQLAANELYLARVSAVRAVELSRLIRTVAVVLGAVLIILRLYNTGGTQIRDVLLGSVLSLLFLLIGRSFYRAYLDAQRRQGKFVRELLIIGTNHEAAELINLFTDHPETGYRVAGVVGSRMEALANNLNHMWKGVAEDAPAVIRGTAINGVIVVVGALETKELNDLVRELQTHNIHVHLSNGVRGINYRRLRAVPIAHEPLFYVEQVTLQRRQVIAKRALDLAGAIGGLIVLSIPFGLIALAVKLGDRGPVFFKQTRVGQDNHHFKVYKFRTMVVDAEARLRELQETNERSGPLFKMERDPRVTRVGHFLRETSLDELPQLINVIKGEMSLVGPRPALPSEVEHFDTRLSERTKVPPGLTGLWQVEARDNPSFSAYRRLDLFYVDNWSMSLDFVILIATVEQVVAKAVRSMRRSKAETAPNPTISSAPNRAA
ncbi:MAG: sugar transferase [Ilumatobacteraceae bacterium]